ncbi:hypothetical protein CLAIMM_08632 [Cladophialophora immunda]|nr:hypothetical protein CLAIMM_08632 [Cladophialophora immunda]
MPMLLLIAGISGNLGHQLASAALRRGLLVRGMGRTPDKVDSQVATALESFVRIKNYHDTDAIQRAVTGVDAVVCAYGATPELYLEAQLVLLREAEKAGVKIFHAQSWNFNWHGLTFGDMEYYDANISFYRQVELTSKIRPVYVFSGFFAHRLYLPTGPGSFTLENGRATMKYWGDGQARYTWTSMKDCAETSIEILTSDPGVLAGKGGIFCIQSGSHTVSEFAEAYERATGIKVELVRQGDLQDLETRVADMRARYGPSRYFHYLRDLIIMLTIQGKWVVQNLTSYDHNPKSSLEDIIAEDKDILGPYSLPLLD